MFSSSGMSVDEGRVDVELYRADNEELSPWPPLDVELFVPPLPLVKCQRRHSIRGLR